MKKILIAVGLGATLLLGGCSETYTFEAVPAGVDDDDAEAGIEGDPRNIECFAIEADSSSGDDGDVQLGLFCKARAGQEPGEGDDTEAEEQDD